MSIQGYLETLLNWFLDVCILYQALIGYLCNHEYVSIKNNLGIRETGMLAPATCGYITLLLYDSIIPNSTHLLVQEIWYAL